jgi:hypothetical protein
LCPTVAKWPTQLATGQSAGRQESCLWMVLVRWKGFMGTLQCSVFLW